jgi:hypothetical protein
LLAGFLFGGHALGVAWAWSDLALAVWNAALPGFLNGPS